MLETYESYVSEASKYEQSLKDAEKEKRRKATDELLQSENSFVYVENISSCTGGWTLVLSGSDEYWLDWLYLVNRVD